MVSAAAYIRAFTNNAVPRFQRLGQLLALKKKIDQEAKKMNFLAEKDISELIQTLGEDSFLKVAEKKKKPTLRRGIWKLKKSFQFFNKFGKKNADVLLREEDKKKNKNLMELMFLVTNRMIGFLEDIDKNFQQQGEVLERVKNGKMNFEEYLILLGQEEKIMEMFNEMGPAIKETTDFLGKSVDSYKARKENAIYEGRIHIGISIAFGSACTMALLFFLQYDIKGIQSTYFPEPEAILDAIRFMGLSSGVISLGLIARANLLRKSLEELLGD